MIATHKHRIRLLVVATAAAAFATVSTGATASPAPSTAPSATSSQEDINTLAVDLYQFAFPIVLMDLTRQQATNVADAAAVPMRAPINQFAHFRSYPHGEARDVVRFNFDTLYSLAWLDLSKEPMILTVPEAGNRYYLVPTLDMWSDVFSSVGTRTTGSGAGNYAYVAPDWHGKLPPGVRKIVAPTSMIWMMGRTQTNGPADYANVHRMQDGYRLTPLSQWGKARKTPAPAPVSNAVDNVTPPLEQIAKLSGVEMMSRLAELMKRYPPHANDYPMLFRMRRIGLEPGKSWDPATVDPATLQALNAGAKIGLADIVKAIHSIGTRINGWSVMVDGTGTYGTSYRQRAAFALGGLGANLPADALYPTAFRDGQGKRLEGGVAYVLHFGKAGLPPADAFWSLTMYDDKGFQVPNALNRFALGDRDPLKYNADGSLDLYIQPESPGAEKESNWLPSPKAGHIGPTLRIYSPRDTALNGEWSPPAFQVAH